jgi:hypothetical protein
MVGGNKADAEKLVGLIAIYSPNSQVPGSTTAALQAWYQYKAGVPIRVGMGANDKKANDLMYKNEFWKGIKTNSFYQNLMVEIDPTSSTPVSPRWTCDGIAFDHAPVDQAGKFMEAEIQRLAGTRLDAAPVQAAI